MYEERNTPKKHFVGVELQIYSKEYHTWGCTIFFLEAPIQEVMTGLPKLEPR